MIDCANHGARLYSPPSQAWMAIISVEAIVEESRWSLPEKPAIIGLRVNFQETELQRYVKKAGGRWNSAKRVWEIHYDQAVALGLKKRIVSWRWMILDIIRCPILNQATQHWDTGTVPRA